LRDPSYIAARKIYNIIKVTIIIHKRKIIIFVSTTRLRNRIGYSDLKLKNRLFVYSALQRPELDPKLSSNLARLTHGANHMCYSEILRESKYNIIFSGIPLLIRQNQKLLWGIPKSTEIPSSSPVSISPIVEKFCNF